MSDSNKELTKGENLGNAFVYDGRSEDQAMAMDCKE